MKRVYAAALAALTLSGCGRQAVSSSPELFGASSTYAERLSSKLDTGDYDIKLSVAGSTSVDGAVCRLVRHGDNGLVSIDKDGVYSEFVTVDGSTLMLMPEIECYRKSGDLRSFGNAFIKVGESDMLFDVSETEDEVTEIYTSSGDSFKEVYTFVFNKETGDLTRAVTESEDGNIFTDLVYVKWSSDAVSIPDLTGWDDISDDAFVSDVTQVKFSMYTDGVTPEMVEAAGYDYEELAKLSVEEIDDIVAEILALP